MIGRPSPLRAPFRPVKTSLLRSAWFAVLLGCGVLAGAPPVACAERKKEPPPAIPPPAQPLSVKVARGESVAILLRIYGRKNQALRYLIRTPPQHGKLTAPRAVELEVSSVTYTPPADLSIVRDRFAYAVQNSAGVSAAADVLITIVDVPAEIGVPEVLNFPMLLVGGTSTQTLEINNRGGGLAEGRVTVDEPWRIDGPANYRIAGGERAVLKVVFAPKEPGIFDTVMRFSSQPGTTLSIHGEARGALTASPAKVLLQHAAGDPVRAGTFDLTNHTEAEVRAALAGGDRLTVPAEVAVPARGTVQVSVFAAVGDVAAFEGEVAVRAAESVLRVPVRAAAVGPIVRATRDLLPLGRVRAGQSAEGQVGLENIGGTAARVSWKIAGPFAAAGSPVTLAAGEKTSVTVRLEGGTVARHRAPLLVAAEQQKLEVPVEAEVFAADLEAPPATEIAAAPQANPPAAAAAPTPAAYPIQAVPEDLLGDPAALSGVKLREVTARGAIMEWPATLTKATEFRLQVKNVSIDSLGEAVVRWVPLPSVTFRQEGESRIATVTELQPATAYAIRVVAKGAESGQEAVIVRQYFETPGEPDTWPKITPLRFLLAVLALCFAFALRQRLAARRRS